MIVFEEPPPLREPLVIAAFEGWNDAADAATGALDHLAHAWDAKRIAALEPDDYYDFQVVRPMAGFTAEGIREISWPTTEIFWAALPDQDVLLVRGLEPNMRWRQFCAELVNACHDLGAQLFVTLGALLADTPHTRPIPITGTASDDDLVASFDLERSTYEGPTGIVGVLQDTCDRMGLGGVSLWAAVPHYVAQPPCPKATLALIGRLETVLGRSLPLGDLAEDARAWERGVDELASDDDEIADYVRQLEESRDAADLPEASGEAIAMEFERYLKRRDSGSEER